MSYFDNNFPEILFEKEDFDQEPQLDYLNDVDIYDLLNVYDIDIGSYTDSIANHNNNSNLLLSRHVSGAYRDSQSSSNDEGIELSPMESVASHEQDELNLQDLDLFTTSMEEKYPALITQYAGAEITAPQQRQAVKQEKKRRKTRRKMHGDEEDVKCYVCLEKAGKHSYYGGRTCPSCRAFFRRAVQSNTHEQFICLKSKDCEINLLTRKNCQYCRFQKCLRSGMRVAWVLPDGEKSKAKLTVNLKTNPVMEFTNEELLFMSHLGSTVHDRTRRSIERFIESNEAFVGEIANFAYFGGKANFLLFKEFSKMCSVFNEELFRGVSDLNILTVNDQEILKRTNGPLMANFKCAVTVDETFILTSTIAKATKSRLYPRLHSIMQKLEDLHLTDLDPKIRYNDLFRSPWASSTEEERKHHELMRTVKSWAKDEKAIDNILYTFMKVVLLFTPDFIEHLERRDLVEGLQVKYILLLRRYLIHKFGRQEGTRRFSSALMMSSLARQMSTISRTRVFEEY